ncbi:hypothetical protein BJ944DRAFT_244030 [Cunninghamella echinulata]|nr:hypothetical protein BJ944DRAFT_244030 [Cunninghamella echinulata]
MLILNIEAEQPINANTKVDIELEIILNDKSDIRQYRFYIVEDKEKKYDDEGYVVTSSNGNDCSDEENYIDYEEVDKNDTEKQNKLVIPKITRSNNCFHCEKCGQRRLVWLDYPLEKKISLKSKIYARKTGGLCRSHFSRAKDELFQTAQKLSWAEVVNRFQGKLSLDLSGKKKCTGCYEVLNWKTNANVSIKFSSINPVCLYSKCVDCIADAKSNREKNKCSTQFIESLITLKADNISSHNENITTKEARAIVLQAVNNPMGPMTIQSKLLSDEQEAQLLESIIEEEVRCNYSEGFTFRRIS